MKVLFLITARGGSVGIPGKNIKKLNGVPLLHYAIQLAREFTSDQNICLSTDDARIISTAAQIGLNVPFVRPKALAGNTASSYSVILHALNWYKKNKVEFDAVVLLQPTSPLRLKADVKKALQAYNSKLDMVVSVTPVKSNPYATIYKTLKANHISKAFETKKTGTRRQDADNLVELNGAVYVFNTRSLLHQPIQEFKNIKKINMAAINAADIDEPLDWAWCEFLLKQQLVKLDYSLKQKK